MTFVWSRFRDTRCAVVRVILLESVEFIFASSPTVAWQDKGSIATRRKPYRSSLKMKEGFQKYFVYNPINSLVQQAHDRRAKYSL